MLVETWKTLWIYCNTSEDFIINARYELPGSFRNPEKNAQPFNLKPQEDIEMVRSTIRMLIPLEKQKEVMEILGSMTEQIQFEPGCIICRLYRDVKEDRAIMLEEIWSSEKDLQRHLGSDKFHTVLLLVEMATEIPEIRFDMISHSTGIETIEKVRANPDRPDAKNILNIS
jgi:quinol monooxygenase YgiN